MPTFVQRLRISGLCRLVSLTVVAWAVAPIGVAVAGSRDDILALEAFLRLAPKEHTPPTEVFAARQKLASLHLDTGDVRKAEQTWRDTVKAFQKGAYDKDGGIVANVTAEAAFRLLESRTKTFVATPILPPPAKMPYEKALEFVMKQLQQQLVAVHGSADIDPEALDEKGGMCQEYVTQVAIYNSLEWNYAAAVMRARLLGHVAESANDLPLPESTPADKAKQLQSLMKMVAERMHQLAEAALEHAWTDAQRRNLSNEWTVELKRELNRYRPAQHPLSRERSRIWLEPAPDEATRALLQAAAPLDDVRACFDRHLTSHPDAMLGDVTVHLTVDPQGQLTELKLSGEGEQMEACLRKKWRAVRDLPHGEAPVQYHVKLQFAAL